MKFEEKLRQFLSKKYAHVGLAHKELNISRVQLSMYLNGRAKPGFQVLQQLSKMGCDIDWLINDEIEEAAGTEKPEVQEKTEIPEKPEVPEKPDINEKLVDIIRELVKNNPDRRLTD